LTLSSFRKLSSGGAPVFPCLLDDMQAMAPDADVVAVYGSTEAEPIAHIARREIEPADYDNMLHGRGLLVGPPVAAIELRILRDQWGKPITPYSSVAFAADCQPIGQPGEIVVSGGHVLCGYLHGRGDEETKFKVDGAVWHRTGDAGYLDAVGRLWLLGRCSARIQDSRGVLYPFAAETALYQDRRIQRAAVVGHRGRRVLAVQFNTDNGAAGLAALKAAHSWMELDDIRVCRHIPVDKRHNAKIDYPALHALLDKLS
jgi:acyl-CoA synthetase (AMP-forming)/AMP-acid ligase II